MDLTFGAAARPNKEFQLAAGALAGVDAPPIADLQRWTYRRAEAVSVEIEAMVLATRLFEGDGYVVQDVSRKRGYNGYDLLLTRDGGTATVEVKGCTRAWHIPDSFATEFKNKRLVADFLCVVYLMDRDYPWACVIPRDAIPPEVITPKYGYRISSKFKKRGVLEVFRREL